MSDQLYTQTTFTERYIAHTHSVVILYQDT